MNRRGFLKAMLAAGTSAYVVTTAGVLMPVRQFHKPSSVLTLWGDGIHDDTSALQALIDGKDVIRDGRLYNGLVAANRIAVPTGSFMVKKTLNITGGRGMEYNFNGASIYGDIKDGPVIHIRDYSPIGDANVYVLTNHDAPIKT